MSLNNGRVLVVDDDVAVRLVMKRLLEMKGYEAELAVSGEDGLAKANKNKFCLILLDLCMKDVDGREFLRQISLKDNVTPIVVLTGVKDEVIENECYELGADGFMVKPFDSEMLDRIIKIAVTDED